MRPVPPPAKPVESAPVATPPPSPAPSADVTSRPDAERTTAGPVAGPFAHRPPKPIGPEAMKALREAIKSGKYPTDDAVRAGLERLIRRPE